MRWIVGIDGRGAGGGALGLARRLAAGAGPDGPLSLIAVRVLATDHLRFVLRYRHLAEVLAEEREALAEAVRTLPDGGRSGSEVLVARTAAEGLEEARARYAADGIIVARASARRRGRAASRVGRTARALLRRLPSPVIVGPPSPAAADGWAGPVVAVSSISGESVTACRVARALADALRRDLTVVHVAGERRGRGGGPRPAGPLGPFARPERALARWLARHAVWPDQTAVVLGELAPAAFAFAEARRAALLAIGTSPATGVRAALRPGPGRWLAAHASIPVLVAPAAAPDERPELLGRPAASGGTAGGWI